MTQTNPFGQWAINLLSAFIPVLAYSIPAIICLSLYQLCPVAVKLFAVLLIPYLFSLLFAKTTGIISLPFQSGIISGKFPRDTGHVVYGKRRIYGTCWTTIFYCKPVYFIILHSKLLKTITFRLFGYRGNTSFTIYPDVWIRDLSLLELGKDAYLSNRCTIGTNICHMDKTISVDIIVIGESSIIGHLAMIAHGSKVGNFSEIGVGCAIGINVSIGHKVKIGPTCTINHNVLIGNSTRIGTMSYIGSGSKIGDNIIIPAGSLIADKSIILNQDDLKNYISSVYLININ